MNDTINTIQSVANQNSLNVWLIIAIVEFLVILYFLFFYKGSEKEKREKKKEVMEEGNLDFDNVINGAFHSKDLYKKLICLCHPDRFPNDEQKIALANEIAQELAKNKYDMKKLKELEKRIKTELL